MIHKYSMSFILLFKTIYYASLVIMQSLSKCCVPGILQARTLEWVAISFSNTWKWKVKVKSLSHVRLLATLWTAAYQAPPSMGFSRQEYWSGVPLPSPNSGVLAWEILWTEKPVRLQSMGSQESDTTWLLSTYPRSFLPHCDCAWVLLFVVPYGFFVSCCWSWPLSRCKHSGWRSQVSACVTLTLLSWNRSQTLMWEMPLYTGRKGAVLFPKTKAHQEESEPISFAVSPSLLAYLIFLNLSCSSMILQFSSVQSLSRVWLFATPWIVACQASLSITNSRSSLRLTSIESVMPSSHLILCRPLLLLPPIPPSIRVFSTESPLCMRWPCEALASVLPMNIQDWSPLEWTDWISLQSKGLSRVFSNTTVQKQQFFSAQLSSQSNSHIHTWPQEKP